MGKKGKSGPRGEAAKTPPAGQTGGGSGPPGIGAKESGSKAGSKAGSKSRSTAEGARSAGSATRGRPGGVGAGSRRPNVPEHGGGRGVGTGGAWWEWVGGLVAGAIVLAVSVGYDSQVYALYFTPRVVVLYPLAVALVLTWLLSARLGVVPIRLDWLDAVAGAFILWQVLSVVFSQTRALAWYGVLNRGGGAMLWITAAVLFCVGRRLLTTRLAISLVGLAGALSLVLAGISALVQLAGGRPPWHGVQVFLAQGRMTGTIGNPVNLAGLSLLSLYVGGLALLRADLRRWVRGALGVGAVLGIACVVLPVSRAGYLGWGAGLAVGALFLVLARRRRALAVVVVVAVVVGVFAFVYNPRAQGPIAPPSAQAATDGESALTESDQSRLEFWRIGAAAILDRPVTGWGQGAYVVAYRALVPPQMVFQKPNVAVSDPHQLLMLLGAGSGVPGLLLGLALLVGPPVLLLTRFRRRGDPAPLLPAAVYGVAALVFLQVSPVDLVVLVPLMLAFSAALPQGHRFAITIPTFRAGPLLGWVAGVAVAAVLVWAVVAGVAFYRADAAFGESMRSSNSGLALRAHELAPQVPEYAQVAGGLLWRQGLVEQNKEMVNRGEAMLRRGLTADPASVTLRAELARLFSSTTRPEQAVDQCRQGLAFSPHYPILQGLWGYSALVAFQDLRQVELSDRLAAELEDLPVDSPDGWHWLGRTRSARGDAEAAAAANAKAAQLAPELTDAAYERRLETGG